MSTTSQVVLPLLDSGKAPADGVPVKGHAPTNRKRWRVLGAVMLLVAGVMLGRLGLQETPSRGVGSDPGQLGTTVTNSPTSSAGASDKESPARTVHALGRLVPETDIIVLAPPFGAADARIAAIFVREGDRLPRGALIAELDNRPHLQDAVLAAQARLDAADAEWAQTRRSVATAQSEARANRERAWSVAEQAKREASRASALFDAEATSQALLEQAVAAAEQAAQDLARADALLARQLGKRAQPDLLLAERKRIVAKADLRQAQGDLAKGQIVAPDDVTVLAIHARVGEKPGARGIATVGDTDRMQGELEIYQDDVGRVAIGQAVSLHSSALPAPLRGHVSRIGWEVERQSVLAQNPAANTDARIVRVRVTLDADSVRRSARYTGLEVVARLTTATP